MVDAAGVSVAHLVEKSFLGILCKAKQMRTRHRRQKQKRTRRMRKQRGGKLGRIPASATVSIQQDAYSPRILVDTETAQDLFEARGPYLL